jgi:pyruvyltransferase
MMHLKYYNIYMKIVNLIYFKDKSVNGNFGDELSKFITIQLINKEKYKLVFNQKNKLLNLICIGSYIHRAKNNSYIFGSGVRTPNNNENGHKYNNLKICSVRGPLSRKFLINTKKIDVPEIYGDPALLLPKFYKPVIIDKLKDIIGIVPHKSNYNKYLNNIDTTKFYLINPTDKWQNVINYICSCKCILSSSLHGLICSDAYNKPNLWLDGFKLEEGDFKFKDYFASQKRDYIKINKLSEYKNELLYIGGNNIDLNRLFKSFPFL